MKYLAIQIVAFVVGMAGSFFAMREVNEPSLGSAQTPAQMVSAQAIAGDETSLTPKAGSGQPNLGGFSGPGDGSTPRLADLLKENDPYKRAAEEYAYVQNLGAEAAGKAMAELAAMPQGTQQLEVEKLLLAKTDVTNPSQALTMAMSVGNVHAALELATPMFQDWMTKDAANAWAWADKLPDGVERDRLLSGALADMAKTDPASTASYILEIASQPGTAVIYRDAAQNVAKRLTKIDPAAAEKFAAQLPDGTAKVSATCLVAVALAPGDPKRAADLLRSNRPTIDSENALLGVMTNWGRKDLTGALAYGQTLTGQTRQSIMSQLVPQLAETDVAGAIALAEKLNNRQVNSSLMGVLPRARKVQNADEALAQAAQIPDGQMKNEFLNSSASFLIATNPASATQVIAALPPGQLQQMAVREAVVSLGYRDYGKAQSYVETMPVGPLRDAGIRGLIFSSFQHLDRATQLAATLSDPIQQADEVKSSYRQWVRQDPAAAQAWLSQSSLDPALRQKLGALK